MPEPIFGQRADNAEAFKKRWQERLPALQARGFDMDSIVPLVRYDAQRVKQGKQPLSNREAALAAAQLLTGTTPIQKAEPDPSVLDVPKNVIGDLKDIVQSLPHLPGMLMEEAGQIPAAMEALPQTLAKGDIAGALALPGVRMLPGAYVGEAVASGDYDELLEHPLMAALDVAPYGAKALKAAKPHAAAAFAPDTRLGQMVEPARRLKRKATNTGWVGAINRQVPIGAARAERAARVDQWKGVGPWPGQETIRRIAHENGFVPGSPMHEEFVRWAELDRLKGAPPPRPEYVPMVELIEKMNKTARDLGVKNEYGVQIDVNGTLEFFPTDQGVGQRISSAQEGALHAERQTDKAYKKLEAERDELAKIEAFEAEHGTRVIPQDEAAALTDGLLSRWNPKFEEMLGEARRAAPEMSSDLDYPLFPGEKAWGENKRVPGRNVEGSILYTKAPKNMDPDNVVRVAADTGEVRSGRLDRLEEQLPAAEREAEAARRWFEEMRGQRAAIELERRRLLTELNPIREQVDLYESSQARLGTERAATQRKQLVERARQLDFGTEKQAAGWKKSVDRALDDLLPGARGRAEELLRQIDEGDFEALLRLDDLLSDPNSVMRARDQAAMSDVFAQAKLERLVDVHEVVRQQLDSARSMGMDETADGMKKLMDEEAALRDAIDSVRKEMSSARSGRTKRQIEGDVAAVKNNIQKVLERRSAHIRALRRFDEGYEYSGSLDYDDAKRLLEAGDAKITELTRQLDEVFTPVARAYDEATDTLKQIEGELNLERSRLKPYQDGVKRPHVRPKKERGLDPREQQLARLYEALRFMDEYPNEWGEGMAGMNQIDIVRGAIRELEAQGVTTPPPDVIARDIKRRRKEMADVGKEPRGKARRQMETLHKRLFDPASGHITKADEYTRTGGIPTAVAEYTKAERALKRAYEQSDDMRVRSNIADLLSEVEDLKARLKGSTKAEKQLGLGAEKRVRSEARLGLREKAYNEQLKRWAKHQNTLSKTIAENAPARFMPLIQENVLNRIKGEVLNHPDITPAASEEAVKLVAIRDTADAARVAAGGDAHLEGLLVKQMDDIWKEVEASWLSLRDAGADPLFIHAVDPKRAASSTKFTHIQLDRPGSQPGQMRTRLEEMAGRETNIEAILTHQQYEWIAKDWSESFLFGSRLGDEAGQLTPGIIWNHATGKGVFGKTYQQIWDELGPEIERRALARGIPLHDAQGNLVVNNWKVIWDEVVGPEYVEFSPYDFARWTQPKRQRGRLERVEKEVAAAEGIKHVDESGYGFLLKDQTVPVQRIDGTVMEVPARMYLPRGMYKTIDAMIPKKSGPSTLYKTYDRALDVFRISALAMSPRFYAYNILGGAVLMMGRSDLSVLRQFKEARRLVGGVGDTTNLMPLGLSRGSALMPETATALSMNPNQLAQWASGNKAGQILAEGWGKIGKVAEKGFALNEWIDNMYRTMTYLDELEKGTVKGMTKEAAHNRAIRQANKVLQDWDSMLPWERSVLRNVVPFYGWLRFILRYTFTYPFDHPLRASIISNAARIELEDQSTGLPERFRSVLWIGQENGDGKQLTVNVGGANPFADIGDTFSLAGMLSQLTPAAQAPLEMMGVDMVSARSQLFPDAVYDPQSGRLVAKGRDPVTTLISSFVPQTEAAFALGGVSADLRDLKRNNPDAWKSRILQSVGVPFSPRMRSRTEEVTRNVLSQERASNEALRRALSTGEWGDADQWQTAYADIDGDGQAELVDVAAFKEMIDQIQGAQR